MGAGIAQVSVDKGMKTILKDMNHAGLARGLNQVGGYLASFRIQPTEINADSDLKLWVVLAWIQIRCVFHEDPKHTYLDLNLAVKNLQMFRKCILI
jgi:hypothetical protein